METEVESTVNSMLELEVEPDMEPEVRSGAEPDMGPEVGPEMKSESEAEPEMGSGVEAEPKVELGAEADVEPDTEPTGQTHRSSGSSGFEKELPLAAQLRDAVEIVISSCFKELRLEEFRKALPNLKDPDHLKSAHKDIILNLHDYVMEVASEIFSDTNIINSLNELFIITQEQPLTFEDVWRPSGDPDADVQAHIQATIDRYNVHFTEIHDKVEQENIHKMDEIEKLEKEILALRDAAKLTIEQREAYALELLGQSSDTSSRG